ncbi:MAG: hypothetical protein MJZ81_07635 [Bacteroidales bacterium]|nr:hypothetical protein [Bacteroidales bacterium]
MRQERLGNIQNVRSPYIRTGAADTWGAVGGAIKDLGHAGLKLFAQMQGREDKRQVDGAVAEGNDLLSKMMYTTNDGVPSGFLVDADDVNKSKTCVGQFNASYEKMLEDLKKNHDLSDRQYEMVREHLDRQALRWGSQLDRHVGATYEKSVQQNAVRNTNSAINNVVVTEDLNDGSWEELEQRLSDPDYLRAKGLVGKEAVQANKEGVIRQVSDARMNAYLQSVMSGTETFMSEKEVGDYFDRIREEADQKRFVSDSMYGQMTERDREDSQKALKDALKKSEKIAASQAESRRRDAVDGLMDEYNNALPDIMALPADLQGAKYGEFAERMKGLDSKAYANLKARQRNADDLARDAKRPPAEKKDRSLDKAMVETMKFDALQFAARPDGMNDEERRKWYERRRLFDSRLTAMKDNGKIGYSDYAAIAKTLDTVYSEDDNRAYNMWDSEFGIDRNRFKTEAQVSKAARDSGQITWDRGNGKLGEMSADDFLEYRARFGQLLKDRMTHAKNSDLEKIVRSCIDEVKAQYVDENFRKIIDRMNDEGRRQFVGNSLYVAGSRAMDVQNERRIDALYSNVSASMFATPTEVEVEEYDENGNLVDGDGNVIGPVRDEDTSNLSVKEQIRRKAMESGMTEEEYHKYVEEDKQ